MKKPNGYWDKSNISLAAKECSTLLEFKERYSSAYALCLRNGWSYLLDDLIRAYSVPHGHWCVKENVKIAAKKYNTRSEFAKSEDSAAYNSAAKNGWIDEVCGHMRQRGTRHLRCVYEIADHEKRIVYVGLTHDISKRFEHHNVVNTILLVAFHGTLPTPTILEKYCKVDIAVIKEKY